MLALAVRVSIVRSWDPLGHLVEASTQHLVQLEYPKVGAGGVGSEEEGGIPRVAPWDLEAFGPWYPHLRGNLVCRCRCSYKDPEYVVGSRTLVPVILR